MKKLILAAALAALTMQPAEAGILRKTAKVITIVALVPVYAVAGAAAGAIVTPTMYVLGEYFAGKGW